MAVVPKAFYIFNAIPPQNLNAILQRSRKISPKIHMEALKKIPQTQSNSKQKEQCWRYHNTNFKLYYRPIVTKAAWYWHKSDTSTNKIEDPEINPPYSLMILTKEPKHTLKNKQPLQQMVLGKLDIHRQKIETRSLSLTLYKNQFKLDQQSSCKV
jgi:hypothetical protein